MKRIYLLFFILPLVCSCIQEHVEGNAPDQNQTELFSFEANIVGPEGIPANQVASKTYLGGKEGKNYPNYWGAGDAILVNGTASESLTESSEYVGTAKAVFDVNGNDIHAPYYYAYPVSAVSGYNNGNATVRLPSTQKWSSTTYDPSAFVMLGKSESQPLAFSPLMSAIRIKVPGGSYDAKISSVMFYALAGESVSGDFTTDFESLAPTNLTSSYVTVNAPSGGAEFSTDAYILIPAQTYSGGVCFVVSATDGTQMTYYTRSAFTALAGKLYPLTTKQYTPDEKGIMMMSSNVRYASAADDTGDRAWDNRKEAYTSMLNTLKPDVVGLQEAEQQQVIDIKEACTDYGHVGYGRESGVDITTELTWIYDWQGITKHGESTTILYRKDKISVQSKGKFWHSDTPDERKSKYDEFGTDPCRISTWAVMTDLQTGNKFFCLNTHLSLNDAGRAKEVELIKQKVAELNPSNLPVVLLGDWNMEEANPILTSLMNVYGSARESALKSDDNYTYHGFGNGSQSQPDHIFYNGFGVCSQFTTVTQKWNDLWISDHNPIYAIFKFDASVIQGPTTSIAGGNREDYEGVEIWKPITILPGAGHEEYNSVDIFKM